MSTVGNAHPIAVERRSGTPEGDHPRPASEMPYCTSCGHDANTHRNGRCWVDAMGEPVTRAWTHIDCKCDGWGGTSPSDREKLRRKGNAA